MRHLNRTNIRRLSAKWRPREREREKVGGDVNRRTGGPMESIWLDGREAKKEKRMRTMYGHHLQSSNQISNDGYFVQVLAIKSQRVRSPRLECGSGRYRRAGKMETQEVFTLSEQQEGEPQFFFFLSLRQLVLLLLLFENRDELEAKEEEKKTDSSRETRLRKEWTFYYTLVHCSLLLNTFHQRYENEIGKKREIVLLERVRFFRPDEHFKSVDPTGNLSETRSNWWWTGRSSSFNWSVDAFSNSNRFQS